MKKIILLVAIIAVGFSSCKKDEIELTPLSSLNVTNAVVGGKTIRLGSNKSDSATNMNFKQFGLLTGNSNIYLWPTADSINPYYNQALSRNNGDVYSLFLSGTPTAVDAIVVKDAIPYRTDSTAGIRFINLAPNSTPLMITLSTGAPGIAEALDLGYKQYTDFKTYPGLYNSTYTFQVRTMSNPTVVLATFSLTAAQVPRFANITLVIRQNGTGLAVFRVNNDR